MVFFFEIRIQLETSTKMYTLRIFSVLLFCFTSDVINNKDNIS